MRPPAVCWTAMLLPVGFTPLRALEQGLSSVVHRRRVIVQKTDGSSETAFSFDRVYGGSGAPFEELYPSSVAPLVDGLFEGYSATAFAYGAHDFGIGTVLGLRVQD